MTAILDDTLANENAIAQLLKAFGLFDIEFDDLSPGEAELGMLVPRESINSELFRFNRELSDLDKIVKVFEELTTGQRRDPKIRSLSSSDLTVLLDMWPVAGAALAAAVERIAAFYKQTLEIKKLKLETKRLELPDTISDQLDTEANKIMETKLVSLRKELLQIYYGADNGRKNEIETELGFALNKIANKVDRGVHFEFRANEPEPAAEGEAEELQANKIREATRSINEAGRRLLYVEQSHEKILQLPEGDNNNHKARDT